MGKSMNDEELGKVNGGATHGMPKGECLKIKCDTCGKESDKIVKNAPDTQTNIDNWEAEHSSATGHHSFSKISLKY